MPGIGSAGGNGKVFNVTAAPDFGYQEYIQDGTSLTDYSFVDSTPFKESTAIQVGKFYTKLYFGPFRDTNEIEKWMQEQQKIFNSFRRVCKKVQEKLKKDWIFSLESCIINHA